MKGPLERALFVLGLPRHVEYSIHEIINAKNAYN